VITADDIRRSGATSLPEVLRLAPGVQVSAISNNKWSVTIRGFSGRFSNKLLVLVDGRSIYSPLFSGVQWEYNDLPLENVERIEVIRGPGGSLWGANAVNGVINITTRSAHDTQGGLLSGGLGTEQRAFGTARYGWALDDQSSLQLYAKAKDVDPSRTLAGATGPDDWQSQLGGFRMDRTLESGHFMLQGSLYDSRPGDEVTATTLTGTTQLLRTGNAASGGHLLARWEHTDANGKLHALQGYLEHSALEVSGAGKEDRDTLNLEYQQQLRLGESHEIVWGLGYLLSRDVIPATATTVFTPASRTIDLPSVFVQDEITLVPERWFLTLGSRFEHNDFSGFEIQPNLRLLFTPDRNDSLWAAVSRAVRTPSRGEADSLAALGMQGPLVVRAVGNPEMDAEKLAALDLGWRRQWSPKVSSDLAGFFYRYNDLRASLLSPNFFVLPPTLDLLTTNAIEADVFGLELSVDWRVRADWHLQAHYAWIKLDPDALDPTRYLPLNFPDETPTQQFSLLSSLDLTAKLRWDVWLRHTSKLKVSGITRSYDIPAYTALDMGLAWKPVDSLEISLVGQNLLDPSHMEFIDQQIPATPVEIERGVYLKLAWMF